MKPSEPLVPTQRRLSTSGSKYIPSPFLRLTRPRSNGEFPPHRVREITRMTMMTSAPISQPSQSSTSSELFKGFSSLSSRLTSGFKEAGIGANLENLISGVKNFLPQDRDLTLTKITESLMDPQNASSAAIARTEHYLYFDPRSANARGTMPPASAARSGAQGSQAAVARGIDASFGQRRQGFSEAIVFTVGGGS